VVYGALHQFQAVYGTQPLCLWGLRWSVPVAGCCCASRHGSPVRRPELRGDPLLRPWPRLPRIPEPSPCVDLHLRVIPAMDSAKQARKRYTDHVFGTRFDRAQAPSPFLPGSSRRDHLQGTSRRPHAMALQTDRGFPSLSTCPPGRLEGPRHQRRAALARGLQRQGREDRRSRRRLPPDEPRPGDSIAPKRTSQSRFIHCFSSGPCQTAGRLLASAASQLARLGDEAAS